ncbi:hypothetical protein VM1G_01250 [Cytospora mali]|uniref:GH16 domain-containing protein n=1 Tax=Cytospora mali TaxID=578113 RepID=A0A194VNL3_CYTMA|nr:hypothetical protein VM1G_01250 [Valsa mali]
MSNSFRGYDSETTGDIPLTDRGHHQINSDPPPYDQVAAWKNNTNNMARSEGAKSPQWYNFKTWSKKAWIIVGVVIAIILVIVIVVPVEVTKNNAYPSYTTLNYTLSETYSPDSFFDKFDYYTDSDPTNGFVTYVSQETAESLNLTYSSSSSAVLRVDTSDADSSDSSGTSSTTGQTSQGGQGGQGGQSSQGGQSGGQGAPGRKRQSTATTRNSVRVTSKNTYNKGLFIFDVIHTPYGCGTWPALWLTDPNNWPAHGEIDIMEAVNNGTSGNQMTLHTASGCKMDHKRKQTGTALHENCYWKANAQAGCGVQGNTSTFGADYNTLGGGITAVEWRSAGIRVWQFERDNIPDDITNNSPSPNSWGKALADFPDTGCDIGSHFKNQSIIINIDLCGDWAGSNSVYTSEFGCPSNCTDYVANNPSEFTKAYWEFGAFQVYQSS